MSPIDSLPSHRDGGTFLYALEFSNGVVKIGRSFKPRCRARQIELKHGLCVTRCNAQWHNARTLHLAERAALKRAAAIAEPIKGHGEFFRGLPFDAAIELIQEAAAQKHCRPTGPHFSQTKEGRRMAAEAKRARDAAKAAEVFARVLLSMGAVEVPNTAKVA